MFNVVRSSFNLTKSNFHSPEVLLELRRIFLEKCYLCESIAYDPVKEHLVAKRNDSSKEFDWNNLYYACKRCNGIKKDVIDMKNLPILDCCNGTVDVSLAIKCLCASVPDDDFIVEAQFNDVVTENTAILLHHCYNADNANNGVARESLHEQIFTEYVTFANYRLQAKSKRTLPSDKAKAIEYLKNMSQDNYPFSIFWKWHIRSDIFLSAQIPE